jgi:hypothetical protein
MSEQSWRITGEEVYPPGDNSRYDIRRTDFVLPNGDGAIYYGALVRPCVHIVAVEDDLTTYLVRQKRPNAREIGESQGKIPVTLELPGGFADNPLGLEASARDELRQEIKRDAASLEHIGTIWPSTGISSERDYIFLGRGLQSIVDLHYEATEQDMRIVSAPFGVIYDQLREAAKHEPISGQTFAAMSFAAPLL